MKYLAHIESSPQSKIVSIYDVVRGLASDAQYWDGRTYYSLRDCTPMIAKTASSKVHPHFAFKAGYGGNESSGGGESIEHQLAKKVIYDNKSLYLKMGNVEDHLSLSDITIEKSFDNNRYVADLYAKVQNKNAFQIPIGSWLVVELHFRNKVGYQKQKFFQNKNIPAVEIDLYKEIAYDGDIDKLYRRLKGYFNARLYARWLSKPEVNQKKRNRIKSFLNKILARANK